MDQEKSFRLKYGGKYCCVVGCHNSTYKDVPRGIKFHAFPKNPDRKQDWVKAINRGIPGKPSSLWQPKAHDVVCSTHFVDGKKCDAKDSPSYIPSIFPTHTKSRSLSSINREKRREERHKRPRSSSTQTSQKRLRMEDASKKSTSAEEDVPIASKDDDVSMENDVLETEDVLPESEAPIKLDYWNQTPQRLYTSTEQSTHPFPCSPPFRGLCFVDVISENEKGTQITQLMDTSLDQAITKEKSTQTMKKCERALNISTLTDYEFSSFCGVSRNAVDFLLYKIGERMKDTERMPKKSRLFLFLARLKQSTSFPVLGSYFGISESSAGMIFREVLELLYNVAKDNLIWFSKSSIMARMPKNFKALFSDVRCIIDCSEVEVEKPSNVRQSVLTYSNYKSRHTFKFLVAVAPSGEIMFISKAWGGRATDTEITANSEFLELLEEGDIVLADKGFPTIERDVNKTGALLVMPPFRSGSKQLTSKENKDGYEIASVRVHVERAIERLKRFQVLHFIKTHQIEYIDKVLVIIAFLCNLQPDLIKDE